MAQARKIYHHSTVTTMEGKKEPYTARVTVETDSSTGKVVYRVYSQVLTDRNVPYYCTGNAQVDTDAIQRLCQRIYEFDRDFGPKPVPKPGGGQRRSKPNHAAKKVCSTCRGKGKVMDECGDEFPCVCQG